MPNLQPRRIDCAIDKAKSIENQLESMGEQIELALNDVQELQRTLYSIRFGMLRETSEVLTPEQQAKAMAYCLANPLPPKEAPFDAD